MERYRRRLIRTSEDAIELAQARVRATTNLGKVRYEHAEKSGVVEWMARMPQESSIHRHRIENLQHASLIINDWAGFYNNGSFRLLRG